MTELREEVRASIANAAQTFDCIQTRVGVKRQQREDGQREWNETLDSTTDAIMALIRRAVEPSEEAADRAWHIGQDLGNEALDHDAVRAMLRAVYAIDRPAPAEYIQKRAAEQAAEIKENIKREQAGRVTAEVNRPAPVVVKELEWDGKPLLRAFTDLGLTYTIRRETNRHFDAHCNGEYMQPTHSTLEAAQAACQAGFAHRISECITAPVVDRNKVRVLVESVMSPDYLGTKELDETTDYICASFTTREQVEREVRADEREDVEIDDVLAWAGEVQGCPDEFQHKLTDQEMRIADAIHRAQVEWLRAQEGGE